MPLPGILERQEKSRTTPEAREIVLSPSRLAACFAWTVTALVLAHGVVEIVRFATGNERLYGLVTAFSLGGERNAPALYSTFALFFGALLLGAIATRSARDRPYWWVLAAVFVFLGLDEFLEIHEKLIVPMRGTLHAHGAFYYAWIIPYGIGAALFGLAYLRFLARHPRRTAVLFVLAGAIFVAGAIGMEMIGGVLAEKAGTRQVGVVLEQTAEEVLEMSGIVLFIYALADYLAKELGGLTLKLRVSAAAT